MKTYSIREMEGGAAIDVIEQHAEWVPAEVAQGLYDALKRIDEDLESRNFLENSSLRGTARAALAAADGEIDE